MVVDMKLTEYDERLLEIHSALYPFVHYGTTGKEWYVESPDYGERFKTYKAFIRFIEEEVKNALLNYAVNRELDEIKEV